jgi:hypothetical protein
MGPLGTGPGRATQAQAAEPGTGADRLQRPLCSRFRRRLTASVIPPMRSAVKPRRNGTNFVVR